jgi:hypothetical protein
MKNIGTQYTFTSQTRLNDGSDRVGLDQVGLFLSFLDFGSCHGRKPWPELDPTHRHVFFLCWLTHDQIYHIRLVSSKAPLDSLGMSNKMIDSRQDSQFGLPKATMKNLPTQKSRWTSYTSKHHRPLWLLARQRIQTYPKGVFTSRKVGEKLLYHLSLLFGKKCPIMD